MLILYLAKVTLMILVTSAGSLQFRDRLSQQLKQLSESESTLKGTTRGLVGFSLFSLLDNCFSRWRWGGIEISALLY